MLTRESVRDTIWDIIDDLPLSFYIKDTQHRFIYVNREASLALGLTSPQSAVGLTDRDLFDESVALQWELDEKRLLENNVPIRDALERELLKTRPDLKQRVLTSKQRLLDSNGNVVGLVGVSKSLTRYLVEFDQIKLAVDGAQDGLWYSNLRTCTVWYSARWKKILGYEDHEIPNDPEEFRQRVHHDDWSLIRQRRDAHLARKSPHYECIFRMRHRTKGWLWILSRGSAHFAEDGIPSEFAGSHTDVTEFTNKTQMYEAIIESLPALVFVKDTNLKFSYVNPELLKYHNKTSRQVLGRTDVDINPNRAQAERFLADDREILAGLREKLIPEEQLTDQRTGNIVYLQTRKQLFEFPSNDPQHHVLGIAMDITGLVQARQKIQDLERSLSTSLETLKTMLIDIQQAPTERDACMSARDSLTRYGHMFGFSSMMLSFQTTLDGNPYIIADPEFATGKWSSVAPVTVRPCTATGDEMLDVLPYILQHGSSEFIANSQTHMRCDRHLCRQYDIVSQYVIPLQTSSLKIGTLQIEMGRIEEKPVDKCGFYDAVAAHLSVAIERHRRLVEIEKINSRLLSTAKLFAFSAAGAAVIHDLKHSLGTYISVLNRTDKNGAVRACPPARDFVKDTRHFVEGWSKSLSESLTVPRDDALGGGPLLSDVVREVMDVCHRKAEVRGCKIDWKDFVDPHLRVTGSFWQIREMISVLIFNAIDAHARRIRIEAQPVETSLPSSGFLRSYGRVRVCDDGTGIAEDYQEQIKQFGWTSKRSSGHGIGLTIVSTLAEALEGGLALISGGKSVGDKETIFELHLPATK